MAKKPTPIKDLKDDLGRPSYFPAQYHGNDFFYNNSSAGEYVANAGELERLIYETGVRIVFEGITDLSQIKYYTLSPGEDRKLFSAVADRFAGVGPNSSGPWFTDHQGHICGHIKIDQLRLTEDYSKAYEAFHKLVTDCYLRAQDFDGLKRFRDSIAKLGYVQSVKAINAELEKAGKGKPDRKVVAGQIAELLQQL